MILVDSNIFMYAAGSYHPNKEPSVAFLKNVAGGRIKVCVSVEILQEILHRYRSINRRKDGKLEGIYSFDEDFESIEGLQRFTPDR